MSYIDNPPLTSFYHAERVPALGLILAAYDLKIAKRLENAPEWAWTMRFTVTAKSDASTDEALAKLAERDAYAEKRHMLQLLLAERFNLLIHPETRVSTTYELFTTPRAAKFLTAVHGDIAATVSTCAQHFSKKGIEVNSTGCPFSILLSQLQQQLGANITDRTGLSGAYTYHLTWSTPSAVSPDDGEERYPDLLNAVHEQLGLELKQAKGPVTFWVIDRLEHPTPN